MTDTTLDRAVPVSPAAPAVAPAQVQVQAHVQKSLNYVPVQNATLKNAGDHPHVPALRALRDAGRRRRPGRAERRQRLRPPALPGPARLRLAGPRARRRRCAGPGPEPTPARNWPGRCAELPDGTVVLLDGLVACGVPEIVVPEADRLRLAVLVHLPLGDETGLDPAGRRSWTPWSGRRCGPSRAVVATSDWAVRRLVAHHGLAPDRVHVAAPGADIAPLASGTDGVSRLLCVAAVTPRKGQHRLVEALADRRPTCPGAASASAASTRTPRTSPSCAP